MGGSTLCTFITGLVFFLFFLRLPLVSPLNPELRLYFYSLPDQYNFGFGGFLKYFFIKNPLDPILRTFCFRHYSWATIFRKLFLKRCTFGSNSGTKSLVRRYQAKFAKTFPEHLKVSHIWLEKKTKKNLCLFIFFIQIAHFSSEYLPF